MEPNLILEVPVRVIRIRKRCKEEGCLKRAEKKGVCWDHGATRVKCKEEGCVKRAEKNGVCWDHGATRVKCKEEGCVKRAEKNGVCFDHGATRVKCKEEGCVKRAENNGVCFDHGAVTSWRPRCPNCIDWLDYRFGNPKYDGYCATCFKRNFPNDPRSKIVYAHTKEILVRNRIQENFTGFVHDRAIYTNHCDCTVRRRVDHRKLFGNTLIAIETDENAHKHYDSQDEEIRYDDLYMAHSGKWIYIRFNPDKKGIDMEDKLDALIEEIQKQISRIENDENTELVEIIYMFY